MDSRKITRPGFSLLEIMLVIVLFGIMTSIVIPQFGGKKPKQERQKFIGQLNALIKISWDNAIRSSKTQKVDFDFQTNKVTLWQSTGQKDDRGQLITEPLRQAYRASSIKIPKQLILRNFFIEGVDEVANRGAGSQFTGAYFYITPEGLAQPVVINFVDRKDKRAGRPSPVGLVLNPFSAQFTDYGTFKTP